MLITEIRFKNLCSAMDKIKNVSRLLRLRCSRYRQTPCNLKRVNAHAERRELSTSVLDYVLSILPIFEQQESKVDVLCLYVLMSVVMLPYASSF